MFWPSRIKLFLKLIQMSDELTLLFMVLNYYWDLPNVGPEDFFIKYFGSGVDNVLEAQSIYYQNSRICR